MNPGTFTGVPTSASASSVAVGDIAWFPWEAPRVVTLNNCTFLRSGVVASPSTYPALAGTAWELPAETLARFRSDRRRFSRTTIVSNLNSGFQGGPHGGPHSFTVGGMAMLACGDSSNATSWNNDIPASSGSSFTIGYRTVTAEGQLSAINDVTIAGLTWAGATIRYVSTAVLGSRLFIMLVTQSAGTTDRVWIVEVTNPTAPVVRANFAPGTLSNSFYGEATNSMLFTSVGSTGIFCSQSGDLTGVNAIRTTDGGTTWTAGLLINSYAGRLNSLTASSSQFIITTNNGELLTSTTGAAGAWTTRLTGFGGQSVVCAVSPTIVLFSEGGNNIRRSTDGGTTWGSSFALGNNTFIGSAGFRDIFPVARFPGLVFIGAAVSLDYGASTVATVSASPLLGGASSASFVAPVVSVGNYLVSLRTDADIRLAPVVGIEQFVQARDPELGNSPSAFGLVAYLRVA